MLCHEHLRRHAQHPFLLLKLGVKNALLLGLDSQIGAGTHFVRLAFASAAPELYASAAELNIHNTAHSKR